MIDYVKLKAIVDEVGADRIIGLYFDNDRVEYFPDGDFNMDDVTEVDGELIVKVHRKLLSKSTNGSSLYDIPVTVYNSELQSVIVLDNAADAKRIDRMILHTN